MFLDTFPHGSCSCAPPWAAYWQHSALSTPQHACLLLQQQRASQSTAVLNRSYCSFSCRRIVLRVCVSTAACLRADACVYAAQTGRQTCAKCLS